METYLTFNDQNYTAFWSSLSHHIIILILKKKL